MRAIYYEVIFNFARNFEKDKFIFWNVPLLKIMINTSVWEIIDFALKFVSFILQMLENLLFYCEITKGRMILNPKIVPNFAKLIKRMNFRKINFCPPSHRPLTNKLHFNFKEVYLTNKQKLTKTILTRKGKQKRILTKKKRK